VFLKHSAEINAFSLYEDGMLQAVIARLDLTQAFCELAQMAKSVERRDGHLQHAYKMYSEAQSFLTHIRLEPDSERDIQCRCDTVIMLLAKAAV
jgi:hypothetical protein